MLLLSRLINHTAYRHGPPRVRTIIIHLAAAHTFAHQRPHRVCFKALISTFLRHEQDLGSKLGLTAKM